MNIVNGIHGFLWQSQSANNCNTYLVDGPLKMIIDPGHIRLFGHVREGLDKLGLTTDDIDLVLLTHAHPDHLEAVSLFKETGAAIAMGEKEWRFVESMVPYLNGAGGFDLADYTPDFFLKEGRLDLKGHEFQIFHTPGHSPGSITLYRPAEKTLFTGDLIFSQGLGRTDLPGGNSGELKQSIRRLRQLDVEYLLPGHGPFLSSKEAVAANFEDLERVWFAML